MPTLIAGKNAPAIMIGEKAADLIKAAKHGSKQRIKRAGRERLDAYACSGGDVIAILSVRFANFAQLRS